VRRCKKINPLRLVFAVREGWWCAVDQWCEKKANTPLAWVCSKGGVAAVVM
jgi:hypothetical protein